MEVFIGIDPGKSGGIATLEGDIETTSPWNDNDFVAVIKGALMDYEANEIIACVEKVSAMPGQGVTSMFNFGKSAGYIEGVLSAMGIPYQLVPPQKWKKEFSLGSDKKQSIAVCERLFPKVDLHRTERCTTKHDGMAEALLLAEYARRHMSRV